MTDTTKYEAFLAAAEGCSLTRAAAVLGYTQPGITRMIDALEKEMGFALFVRTKRGVTLTENGRAMLPAIRSVVRAQRRTDQLSSDICGVLRGVLTIGCYWSVSALILPDILKTFLTDYPQVRIRLKEDTNVHLSRLLREGAVDVCFSAKPTAGTKCDWLPLIDDELRVWLPQGHEYAKAPSFPVEKLSAYPFIITQDNQDTDIDRVLKEWGIEADIHFATTDAFSTYCMVEAGLGISFNQQLIASRWQGRVVTLPFDPPQYVHLGLAVPSLKEASPAAKKFIACVQEQIKR